MKSIFNFIRDFKYKTITAVLLIILTQAVYLLFDVAWVSYISMALFLYLIFVIYRLMYKGIQNTYKIDGSKTLAIVLSIIVCLFTLFVGYIVLFKGFLS